MQYENQNSKEKRAVDCSFNEIRRENFTQKTWWRQDEIIIRWKDIQKTNPFLHKLDILWSLKNLFVSCHLEKMIPMGDESELWWELMTSRYHENALRIVTRSVDMTTHGKAWRFERYIHVIKKRNFTSCHYTLLSLINVNYFQRKLHDEKWWWITNNIANICQIHIHHKS